MEALLYVHNFQWVYGIEFSEQKWWQPLPCSPQNLLFCRTPSLSEDLILLFLVDPWRVFACSWNPETEAEISSIWWLLLLAAVAVAVPTAVAAAGFISTSLGFPSLLALFSIGALLGLRSSSLSLSLLLTFPLFLFFKFQELELLSFAFCTMEKRENNYLGVWFFRLWFCLCVCRVFYTFEWWKIVILVVISYLWAVWFWCMNHCDYLIGLPVCLFGHERSSVPWKPLFYRSSVWLLLLFCALFYVGFLFWVTSTQYYCSVGEIEESSHFIISLNIWIIKDSNDSLFENNLGEIFLLINLAFINNTTWWFGRCFRFLSTRYVLTLVSMCKWKNENKNVYNIFSMPVGGWVAM